MPKHDISFTVTLTVTTTIDPDDLSDFTGDSAEVSDVETYLEENVLSDWDALQAFGNEVEPDVVINGYTKVNSKLSPLTDDDTEE